MTRDVTIEPLAEDALLLRFGDEIDADVNARVHEVARTLRAMNLAGILDIAPAYATLLVRFDLRGGPGTRSSDTLPHEKLAEALRAITARAMDPGLRRDDEQKADSAGSPARTIEVPVCYGGDHGPDLAEVATHAQMAPEEVIARHSAGNYTVAMIGFAPGFPYLLGLDPALETPRRGDPRTRVPTGSVAIGGAQTGIYPRELPGGWQLIGRTPLVLFDPAREQPCLLAPGDRVRFRAIDGDEFATLAGYP
jgi:KipI family sensor histidine kinase inhibitor